MNLKQKALAAYRREGRNLRDGRTCQGLSLRDLSKRTGVSHATISRFERGRSISAPAYVALLIWNYS